MSDDMPEDTPRPEPFWSVGYEVGLRSKVVESRWDPIGRTYTYRLSGIDGWYDEDEITT